MCCGGSECFIGTVMCLSEDDRAYRIEALLYRFGDVWSVSMLFVPQAQSPEISRIILFSPCVRAGVRRLAGK